MDYVIGEQPLSDEQLEFLNYFDKLQKENEKLHAELELYKGTLQENHRLIHSTNDFENWLETRIKNVNKSLELDLDEESKALLLAKKSMLEECLEKLQELKEGKK